MANPDFRPREPGPRPGVCDREQPSVHGGYPGDFPLDRGCEMAGQSRTVPVPVPWVDAPHGRGHSRRTLRPAEGRESAAAMRPIPAPWLLHRLLPRRHAVTRRAGLAFQRRTVPVGHSGESPDTPAGGGGLRRRPAEEFLDLRREPRCATPRPQGRVRRWLGHEAECGAAGRSSASNRRRVAPAARGEGMTTPKTWRLLVGTAFFTLIEPVAVAVIVPWLLLPAHPGTATGASLVFGVLPIACGALIYIRCAADFIFAGHGTPAPYAPPK